MTINKKENMEQLKEGTSYELDINKECHAIIFKRSSIYVDIESEYKLVIYKIARKYQKILETEYVEDIEKIFTILEIVDFD